MTNTKNSITTQGNSNKIDVDYLEKGKINPPMDQEERRALGHFILRAREEKRISQNKLAKLLNKSPSTISRYESGSVSISDQIKKEIAAALEVNYYDMPGTIAPNNLVVSEDTVPLIGAVVAGEPLETYPDDEEIGVRYDVIQKYPNVFALKVHGDSMNKKVPNGSIVYVNPQETLENGEIGIIRINGSETTMKRFYKLNDGVVLEPESWLPDYKSKIYQGSDAEDIHIQGKVVSWAADPRETL